MKAVFSLSGLQSVHCTFWPVPWCMTKWRHHVQVGGASRGGHEGLKRH